VTATPTDLPSAEEILVRLANPANGETLFNTFQPAASFACSTCHRADSEDRLIGPGLLNIGIRAETRVEGQSAIEYIYASIVDPSAYVVDTYPDGLMPPTWAEIYSESEIYDIIAYLMTLR
jgi:cytochrome c2